MLTNEEVIAINQAGMPARPLSQADPQQVWYTKYDDGSYVVALFNLGAEPATVKAAWNELGIAGPASVRDVWQGKDIGTRGKAFRAKLPSHGTRLLRITPRDAQANSPSMPSRVHATASSASSVSLAWDASTSMDQAGRISYRIYANGKQVARTSGTEATVEGLDPSTVASFSVRATDEADRLSARSKPVSLTTPSASGPKAYEAEASTNTLGGSATISDCSGCSGGKRSATSATAAP